MKISFRQQQGFSLMEIIITMVLSSFLIASWMLMLFEGFRDYFALRDFNTMYQQGQIAVERFTRDLEALKPSDLVATSNDILIVNNCYGHTVTYSRDATHKQFLRQQDSSTSQPLAFYLDDTMTAPFTYYMSDASTTTTVPAQAFFISLNLRLKYTAADGNTYILPMSTLVYLRGP